MWVQSLRMRMGIFAVMCCAGLVQFSGCGGSPTSPPAAPPSTLPAPLPAPAATTVTESPQAEPVTTAAAPATTPAGRKFVGDIPYDVFFDDPYSLLANSAPVAAPMATSATTVTTPTPEPVASTPAPVAAEGSADWSQYLTADHVKDELKKVRNHLDTTLKSLGSYNSGVKDVAVDGALISALARIQSESPDEVTWKANAALVEDYGRQIWDTAAAENALGRPAYEKVQAAHERLVAVLSGNVPADAQSPPAGRTLAEIATRRGLMKRIEKASDYLKKNINTEQKLKSEQEAILHEAALIAAFGKVCSDLSYDSADEDAYKAFAASLVEGAQEARQATKDQAFDKYQQGINKVIKACSDCHNDYATGG